MKLLPPSSPTVEFVPPTPRRRKGLLLVALALVILVLSGAALWTGDDRAAPAPPHPREVLLDVVDGPERAERVQIDATLYAPADTPAPAVVLSHGFGGDKNSVAAQARELARRGFTVLTHSSRGFGRSSGKIALNAPEYEVADARQLLDWLARQPEVLRDADGDPRVGVTGDSYGGALSLLLAGSDSRVDALAPMMTYNDLNQALLPNAATRSSAPATTPARGAFSENGVFKQAWAGMLFSAGGAPRDHSGPRNGPGERAESLPGTGGAVRSKPANTPATCGNFTPQVCAAYTEIAQTGRAGRATRELLARVSPRGVTDSITAPTLLVQGERDTLFGLSQADANARQIANAGGKVKTIWYSGGHDGNPPGPHLRSRVADWFAFHLGGVPPVPDPGTGFEYEVAGEPRGDGETPVRTLVAPAYPGIHSERTPRHSIPLRGGSTRVINPPGGSPAATSSLPGAGPALEAMGSLGHSLARDLPGQVAVFQGDPADRQLVISGAPRTRLTVAAVPGQPTTDEAVLFAKLYDVGPDGRRVLAGNAVSPLRVRGLPADGTPVPVDVTLPGVVHSLEAGHHLELAVSTTDQAYATTNRPAVHSVGLAGANALSVPSVEGVNATPTKLPTAPLAGIGSIGVFALIAWGVGMARRRHTEEPKTGESGTPLVLSELSKSYSGDTTAVQGLSMRVEQGQIVGMLGPNGAGKTTTLRLLLGLLHPSSGTIRLFGHRVRPGAPVLSRVGALVEAPGFLPHLSGMDNLRYYWAATSRPMTQARFDEVLRIADLGPDAHRRVRTYSQGMKQRLGLAQAMLGLPELLVLDEPVNGLDPPQIHQLREVLRRYASTGRTVLLSSHLLSEVEQTCTHIVVMHDGGLISSGTVDEIVAVNDEVTFRVDEPEQAANALRRLEGLGKVTVEGDLVHAELRGHTVAMAVNALVDAEVSVNQVHPRRRLEDAFLQLVGEERS